MKPNTSQTTSNCKFTEILVSLAATVSGFAGFQRVLRPIGECVLDDWDFPRIPSVARRNQISNPESLMTTTADTTEAIFQRLKKLGFSASEATGMQHSVPKIKGGTGAERKAMQTNEEEARQNQRHYLDESSKNGNAWFQNVKTDRQYSEFVLVSPEMARELLAVNENPRKRIMQDRIDRYANDMGNGRWHDNSQSIAIDYNSKLHNGQHRISALIQCGKPQRLYFTFNTLVNARLDEDTGASRSVTVQIEQQLHNNIGCKLPAVCRAAMRGASETRMSARFSQSDYLEFAKQHGPTIEWIVKICPGHRSDVIAAFLKATLWYGPDQMEGFIRRFADVLFTSKDDPAKLLHQQAKFSKGTTRLSLYRKTLSAVHHYIHGKTVSKLLERDKDLFDWEPGWIVPQKESK